MKIARYVANQIAWSTRTFGPGKRFKGIIQHLEKELQEVKDCNGTDLEEWVDIVILALDGAWRAGHTPAEIETMLIYKFNKNMARKWPDWHTFSEDQAIEHVREEERYPTDPKDELKWCFVCKEKHSENQGHCK